MKHISAEKTKNKRLGSALMQSILTSMVYGLFATLFIIIFSSLFHFELLRTFITTPYITGWDGAAHAAIMEVFSKSQFPSTWGWVQNWFNGMPFPNLYPPFTYLFGAWLIQMIGNTTIAYKTLTYIIFTLCSASALYSLIYIFKKDSTHTDLKKTKLYLLASTSIAILFSINSGSPGPGSIFLNTMIAQNLSMVFIFPALFSFLSKSKLSFVIGSISWSLMYLTNIHTALCSGLVSVVLALCSGDYSKEFYKRFIQIHLFGLICAGFWIIPMLETYPYFSGISLTTPYFVINLAKDVWPHLCIALAGIFISYRHTTDPKKTIFRFSVSVLISILVVLALFIISIKTHTQIPLPIHFSRWFETYLFLLAVPYAFALTHIYKYGITLKFRLKTNTHVHVKGVYILSLIVISIFTTQYLKPINLHGMYTRAIQDNVQGISQKLATAEGLTLIHSRAFALGGNATKPMALESETGLLGGKVSAFNLRESSANGAFLRIARNVLSKKPEDWGLVSFYKPMITQTIEPDKYYSLYKQLGISQLVFFDDTYPDTEKETLYFSTTTRYKIDKKNPGYTIATISPAAPEASHLDASIGLFFGKSGYRERKITELNYSRLQESLYEHDLENKYITLNLGNTANPNVKQLIKNSDFTIVTDYAAYSADEWIQLIDTVLSDNTKSFYNFYLYDDNTEKSKIIENRFVRSTKVTFFRSRNSSFPFEPLTKVLKNRADANIVETALVKNFRHDWSMSFVAEKYIKKKSQSSKPKHSDTEWFFIRSSYSPAWQAYIGTEKVQSYPASPLYTLIAVPREKLQNQQTITLVLRPTTAVIFGHILTLLGYLYLLLYAFVAYFRSRNIYK